MTGTTYLEEAKNEAAEVAQILRNVPENKKEGILMLVTGYVLGLESEEQRLRTG